MDYYKLENDKSGIYITKEDEDTYFINITENNSEDAVIELNGDEFNELVINIKKMI